MQTLFKCNTYTFHTVTKQAESFAKGLSDHDWARFSSACNLMSISLKTGQDPAGRIQRVSASSTGLFEIRITPRGAKGPALRMLCVVEGSNVFCVRGVDKRQRRIPAGEITKADKALIAYREANGEPTRTKDKKKGGD
jgi:hypothetical protein